MVAVGKQWQKEVPIPRGGPHMACVVVDEKLYVIGGQEGDFMAKPGSPVFKCSRRHEVFELCTATILWLISSRLPSCSQCCFRWSMRMCICLMVK